MEVTTNHFFSKSLHLIKGHQGSSLLGMAKNVNINRRAKRHSLMAHPFKLSSKSNVTVQLVEGTSSYSVSCNTQNSADRSVKYHETDVSH